MQILVTNLSIGPVPGAKFEVTQMKPATGEVGTTIPVTLDGVGFTSDILVAAGSRGAYDSLQRVTGLDAVNVTIPSPSLLTFDLVVDSSVPPGTYLVVVLRKGLTGGAGPVIVYLQDFVIESP